MDTTAQHQAVYDLLADEYEARVPVLRAVTQAGMQRLAHFLPPGAKLLDVGCGPGGAIQILTEMGYHTSGIDLSPRMAELAKSRNPASTIVAGDILTYPFPDPFDAIVAFAFIHLFPAAQVPALLGRLQTLLVSHGLLYVGTSRSSTSQEGWVAKADYPGAPLRFRKHWQDEEFATALTSAGFTIADRFDHPDPFGKVWMDYILRAPA